LVGVALWTSIAGQTFVIPREAPARGRGLIDVQINLDG
jgi:hypothetical protein